jgi:hypothetical protein
LRKLFLDARQKAADVCIGSIATTLLGQSTRFHAGQSKLVDRARQCLRKPGHRGNWPEVVQLALRYRVEDRACRNGFSPDLRGRQAA